MLGRNLEKLSHTIRNVAGRNSLAGNLRKRAIMRFTEKAGFVYFGSVDQYHDDHHIIRGLTVSSSHRDNHYSVGSFEGYDVSLVDRVDVLETTGGHYKTHKWLILEVDLHHAGDLPHLFLGSHNHRNSSYAKLFTAFPALQPVPLGTFEPHSDEFKQRYSLFAAPSHFIEVEAYFTAMMTRTIAAHFWPLAVEISEGSLFVYSDSQVVTTQLLEVMLKNGLWLARQIDAR
ncbi:MAG: hypothetical protein ABI716_01970 [Candidatus Saccharibacteria bacterium]